MLVFFAESSFCFLCQRIPVNANLRLHQRITLGAETGIGRHCCAAFGAGLRLFCATVFAIVGIIINLLFAFETDHIFTPFRRIFSDYTTSFLRTSKRPQLQPRSSFLMYQSSILNATCSTEWGFFSLLCSSARSMFLFALASISLILFSWFTSDAPGS